MKRVSKRVIGMLLVLCFVISLFSFVEVRAAGAGSVTLGLSSNKSTYAVGESVVITMRISNVSVSDSDGVGSIGGVLNYDKDYLTYEKFSSLTSGISFSFFPSTNKFAWVYSGSGIKGTTNLVSFTFKAKQKGTTNVKINNALVSDTMPNRLTTSVSGKSITIGDAKPSTSSNNAYLKSLSVSGYSIQPGFSKGTTNYTLTVPNATSSVTVNAGVEDSKASVTGTGKKSLKVGDNTIKVVVTAQDGTKKTYTITVTRKGTSSNSSTTTTKPSGSTSKPVASTTKSNDNSLKSLSVKNYPLSPSFNKDETTYSVKVPKDVNRLDFSYQPSSSKAKVEVIGNSNFKEGEVNPVKVKVTAEDGSTRIYTINVDKARTESDNKLKSLEVNGFSLSPKFNRDTNTYSLKVKDDTNSIHVSAIAENKKAKVEIVGADSLQQGNNVVLVKVTDENGFTNTYQLNVEKPSDTIFGMSKGQFIMGSIIGAGIAGLLITNVVSLFRKRRLIPVAAPGQEAASAATVAATQAPTTPVIEFNPEFNFGSKNGTDDDIIYPNGVFNQGSSIASGVAHEQPKIVGEIKGEIPYNPYDEVVTKDELIDAIQEGLDTNNPEKLQMLLKQEELNRMKDSLKKKEGMHHSDDEW